MIRFVFAAALLFGAGQASANELDNEGSVTNQELQGTVVVRVDKRTNTAAILKSDATLSSDAQAKALTKGNFKKLSGNQQRSELDQDGGASSWYWYCNSYNYGYNYLNWYGYNYTPYYSYSYSNYNYYYYSSSYYRWW